MDKENKGDKITGVLHSDEDNIDDGQTAPRSWWYEEHYTIGSYRKLW